MAVISFEISHRKPYAGGREFGATGAYEQIDGSVTFAVDPELEANAAITDLENAPRDSEGRVRFRADVSLLMPAERSRGSGRVVLELTNRGRKLFGRLNG